MKTVTVGIYFIDRFNIDNLYGGVLADDAMAKRVYGAVLDCQGRRESCDCALCDQKMAPDDVVFVVMAIMEDPDGSSLTSCVCAACAKGDDLEAQLEEVMRIWRPDIQRIDAHFSTAIH